MNKLFHTNENDIIKMSWDEIQELMSRMIKHNLYDEFVGYLGKSPHVIKHDYFIEKMNQDRLKNEDNDNNELVTFEFVGM